MREILISSPAKNAISTAVLEALARDLAVARGEPILLTGAGDVFSAGLDLSEVATLDVPGARRLLGALEHLVEALFTYPAPTVALVNGHAIAGGCVLALCCDWRVATADPRARIGLNEVAIGLSYPPRTLAMVRARLSPVAAERVVLGAQLHDPAAALSAGLVDEVAADPRRAAEAALAARAKHPAAAYADAKARLRGALRASDEELQAFEREGLPRWGSEETRAMAARFLKR
jgi:enoyl-CoA hydratase/carnithine racemase